MYNYISGQLTEKLPTVVTVDVGGVGYQVVVSLSTHQRLPHSGAHVKLFVHFVVREDSQQLFGFLTEEEREIFRLLISVSGVGPKMAMMILSGIELDELKQAIADGAVPVLSAISGIGKKTAERVIVELREKIIVEESRGYGGRWAHHDSLFADALQALVSLGYKKHDAKEAIQKVLAARSQKEKMKVEDLIRQALKYV